MSKQGQPGNERTFSYSDPAFLLGLFLTLFVMCWVAWYFCHEQISTFYVYVRYVQLWLFSAIGSVLPLPGFEQAHNWVQTMCGPESILGLCQRDFSSVTWEEIATSTIVLNGVFWTVLVLYCVKMFIRVNKEHPKLNYVKTHNIASFVKENKHLYPHLRMFSEIDLISEALDHPVFGMSQTSRQFTFVHRLISGWKDVGEGAWQPTLDRDLATQVFRRQLGKHWTKSTDLSVGETLLAAIAIPRVAATDATLDDDSFKEAMGASTEMILWCWDQFKKPAQVKPKESTGSVDPHAWLKPDIDLSKPRALILKYIGHANVQAIIEKHAFNRTVIFALFMQARRLGVLQPAEMRWMRFFDRELWYVLQTIGRQAGFAEAAGVLSHYLYEAKSQAALAEPQLDKAVNGLDLAMGNFKYLLADKLRYEKGVAEFHEMITFDEESESKDDAAVK